MAKTRAARHERDPAEWLPTKPDISARQALAAIGTVVYAVRLDGGVIKIGCTSNLNNRVDTLRTYNRSASAEVLAFMVGDMDDEAAIHESLVDHRARCREYYHPDPEVLAVVNDMRDHFGLPHVAV